MTKAFCIAKASHIFSEKNIGKFQILTFEILKEMLTNDVVSFEQPGPIVVGLIYWYLFCRKRNYSTGILLFKTESAK